VEFAAHSATTFCPAGETASETNYSLFTMPDSVDCLEHHKSQKNYQYRHMTPAFGFDFVLFEHLSARLEGMHELGHPGTNDVVHFDS
jgi:hypothetical protein